MPLFERDMNFDHIQNDGITNSNIRRLSVWHISNVLAELWYFFGAKNGMK